MFEEARDRGAAILSIFHDQGASERLCDRVIDVGAFAPAAWRVGLA